MKLQSIVTCPKCGFEKEETMPTNYCQLKYKCSKCGFILTPKIGDCCIYCSYGTEKCPPLQEQ